MEVSLRMRLELGWDGHGGENEIWSGDGEVGMGMESK